MTDEQLALACGLMIGALLNFIKAKRKGHGCVTLHWR